MPSAAGDQYSPGPDPDFSYLSLLQPNLLFVQDIQRYVDLATSLGAMADAMQGLDGCSLLALRSQVAQYAGTQAWSWMMDDPTDLPVAMTYQTALGHTVPFYDVFLPSAAGDYFSPSDLVTLRQYLDDLPPLVLQYEHYIVAGPVNEMVPAAASETSVGGPGGGGQSSIESTTPYVYAQLPHEIACTFFNGIYPGPLGQEWDVLWQQSTDPIWDTADVYSGYPPRPMPANEPIPWGDTSEYEDFMTIVSNWADDSATPRLNPSRSSSMLEQASRARLPGRS